MTTVMGLRHPKINAAVLIADRQTTLMDRNRNLGGKRLLRKIWTSKDGLYAVGHAGSRDSRTEDFLGKLVDGQYDIKKVLSGVNKSGKGYFPQLRAHNVKKMGRDAPNLDDLSSLVMLTRFDDNTKVFLCNPLGNIYESECCVIGSGQEKVTEYLNAREVVNEANNYLLPKDVETELPGVIELGLVAVRRAQAQDIYSHGLDMIVATPEGIKDHVKDLGDDFGEKLAKMKSFYEGFKQENLPKDNIWNQD